MVRLDSGSGLNWIGVCHPALVLSSGPLSNKLLTHQVSDADIPKAHAALSLALHVLQLSLKLRYSALGHPVLSAVSSETYPCALHSFACACTVESGSTGKLKLM